MVSFSPDYRKKSWKEANSIFCANKVSCKHPNVRQSNNKYDKPNNNCTSTELPSTEVRGSNPVIGKIYIENCLLPTVLKSASKWQLNNPKIYIFKLWHSGPLSLYLYILKTVHRLKIKLMIAGYVSNIWTWCLEIPNDWTLPVAFCVPSA